MKKLKCDKCTKVLVDGKSWQLDVCDGNIFLCEECYWDGNQLIDIELEVE